MLSTSIKTLTSVSEYCVHCSTLRRIKYHFSLFIVLNEIFRSVQERKLVSQINPTTNKQNVLYNRRNQNFSLKNLIYLDQKHVWLIFNWIQGI